MEFLINQPHIKYQRGKLHLGKPMQPFCNANRQVLSEFSNIIFSYSKMHLDQMVIFITDFGLYLRPLVNIQ